MKRSLDSMDDKTKKTLALVGLGVGGVVVAYALSNKKPNETQQTANNAQQSAGVVPIPALLAQSSQRAANNVATSNPVPQNVTVPTQQAQQAINQSGGLSSFYEKFGLRAYTANDAGYEQAKGNYNALIGLGNNSWLQVPTYVTDKTTLLKHLNIVSTQYANDANLKSMVDARISQVNAIQ